MKRYGRIGVVEGAVLLVLAAALAMQGSYIICQPTPIFPSTGTPSLIQAVEAHNAGTPSSLAVSFGSLPATANVVVAGMIVGNASTGAIEQGNVVTDNQANNYVRLVQTPASSVGTVPRVSFWCTIVTASSGTFTVTGTINGNDTMGMFALEYAGTTCNPDKLTGGSPVSDTSPYSCGSFTTSNAHDLLLTFLFTNASTGTITFTAPTGFTIEKSQTASASGRTGAIADEIVAATNTFTPTFAANQNLTASPCAFVALLSK